MRQTTRPYEVWAMLILMVFVFSSTCHGTNKCEELITLHAQQVLTGQGDPLPGTVMGSEWSDVLAPPSDFEWSALTPSKGQVVIFTGGSDPYVWDLEQRKVVGHLHVNDLAIPGWSLRGQVDGRTQEIHVVYNSPLAIYTFGLVGGKQISSYEMANGLELSNLSPDGENLLVVTSDPALWAGMQHIRKEIGESRPDIGSSLVDLAHDLANADPDMVGEGVMEGFRRAKNVRNRDQVRRTFIVDAKTGNIVRELGVHRGRRHFAEFSSQGEFVASGSITSDQVQVVSVEEVATGRIVFSEENRSNWVGMFFSDDDVCLMRAYEDGLVRVDELRTSKAYSIWTIPKSFNEGVVVDIALSPDRTRIAVAHGNSVGIYRAEVVVPAPLVAIIEGHTENVFSLQWSPDGKQLLIYYADGVIRGFDGETGRVLFQLKGHLGLVKRHEYTPSNSLFTESDESVRIWDTTRFPLSTTSDEKRVPEGSYRIVTETTPEGYNQTTLKSE